MADAPAPALDNSTVFAPPTDAGGDTLLSNAMKFTTPADAGPAAVRSARSAPATDPNTYPTTAKYSDTYSGGKGPDETTNQALKVANAATEGGPNWMDKHRSIVIPLLSGLGAMASSDSRYLGSAVLQGLGAGAQAYGKERDEEMGLAQHALKTGEQGTIIGQNQQQIEESKARTAGERASNWQRGTITQNWAGTPFSAHIWDTPEGPMVVKDVDADDFRKMYPKAAWRDPNTPGAVSAPQWNNPSVKTGAATPVVKDDSGAPVVKPEVEAPVVKDSNGNPVVRSGARTADVTKPTPGQLPPGVLYPQEALDKDRTEQAFSPRNSSTAAASKELRTQAQVDSNVTKESDSRLKSYAAKVADSIFKKQGGTGASTIEPLWGAYVTALKAAGFTGDVIKYTDAESAREFMAKNQATLSGIAANSVGQKSNAAREALAIALPNLDMQPDVRADMMAGLITDQQRVKDIHAAYDYSDAKVPSNSRTYQHVVDNYDKANGDRNIAAKHQISALLQADNDFATRAFRGEFTADQIERHLSGNGDPRRAFPGYDPSLQISRFFPHKVPKPKT